MGKAIRFNQFSIIVLLLVISPLFVTRGLGQVSITDSRAFEVSFTEDETNRMRAGIELSVHSSVLADDGRSRRFTSTKEQQGGSFFVESYGEISFGTYYNQKPGNILADLPFQNATSESFDKLYVAFDFVYLSTQTDEPQTFQLSYRINGGEWIQPSGGSFSSEFLQTDESGWNTFSMQITLDQLFLRPDDTIELRWSSSALSAEDEFLPVALQKIGFYPSVAVPKQIRPGSLIITELMPRHRTGRGFVEYAEIYNSTEYPVNLKGLILEAGFDAVVILHNLIVDPYQTAVIANYAATERFDEIADYKYSGTLLGGLSGRLEARFDETEVAKALYDAREPGVAQQLDHLQNAYDGYSGMRYFASARQQWNNIFYGDPGNISVDRKLFTKTITNRGWHVFTPPGHLPASLNRDLDGKLSAIFRIDDTEPDQLRAPFLYYHGEDKPVTLYSVVEDEQTSGGEKLKQVRKVNLTSLDITLTEPIQLNRIMRPQGGHSFPALLSWNNDTQAFKLLWREDDIITPWSAVFAPGIESNNAVQLADAGSDISWQGLRRMVELTLIEEAGASRGATAYDRALIGFWDKPSEIEGQRLDLPKIWSPIQETAEDERVPFIYLKASETNHQTNSFINYDRTPDGVIQVAVGVRLNQTNGRYRIEWDEIDSLPDHWEIEFVDAELNENINMRREHSYSFSERSDQITQGMRDPGLNFKKVEETDYSRFFVRISSTGQLGMFERDNESPDSIELKQNYPNPFNPSTTVIFYLPNSTHVKIGVYNVVGQQVGVLVDDRLSAGEHTVVWNAMDMPSGVYIVQLEAGNTVETRKITLIK